MIYPSRNDALLVWDDASRAAEHSHLALRSRGQITQVMPIVNRSLAEALARMIDASARRADDLDTQPSEVPRDRLEERNWVCGRSIGACRSSARRRKLDRSAWKVDRSASRFRGFIRHFLLPSSFRRSPAYDLRRSLTMSLKYFTRSDTGMGERAEGARAVAKYPPEGRRICR
jgi:hypothetical protein